MNLTKIITLMLVFIAHYSVAQQSAKTFTLDQAINHALQYNRTAVNANADIEAAQKQRWETIAQGLPQIDATLEYQNLIKLPVSLVDFNGDGVLEEQIFTATDQTMTGNISLNQLIFDGTYLVGLEASKTFLKFTENRKEKSDVEIRKAVIEAYGNVLLAKESVKIAEQNKQTLEKNVNETTKIFENGLGDKESVEQLQITLLGIENQLSNAKRLEVITTQMLKLILGVDTSETVTLAEGLENLAVKKSGKELLSSDFELNNNIDFKIAETLVEQRFLEMKLERMRRLPSLGAFIGNQINAFSNEFSFLNTDQKWYNVPAYGARLSVPIFSSGKSNARVDRAKIELDKANTDLEETTEQLNLQLATARSNFEFAVEQYDTSKKNLDLAERIEKKNQIKFFEGIGSSFQLRQAQTQLYAAQNEYLRTMLEVVVSKSELESILNAQ